jgi:L-malate glycosyltransferase
MKLAFIAPGSVGHTTKWVNSLAEEGLDVTLITQHRVTASLHSNVKVKYLPFTGTIGYFLNTIALNRLIKRLKPDVINVHYATGYGTLALLSRIKPYILSVWGSDVYEYPYLSKLKMWLTQKSLLSAQKIASTSEAMATQVLKVVNPVKDEIAITPFGIDLSLFTSQRPAFNRDIITIGIVKTLEHKYGVDLLLNAFATVEKHLNDNGIKTPLKLLIVGGGPLEQALKEHAEKLALESKIEFVGKVDNSQVCRYINDMDIFVVPSRIESFGVAAVEALACERPCIVANTGGLPGVVLDGETGKVVDAESARAIAQAIIDFINAPNSAIHMGKAGRQDVLVKYDQKNTVKNMINLYQEFHAKYV